MVHSNSDASGATLEGRCRFLGEICCLVVLRTPRVAMPGRSGIFLSKERLGQDRVPVPVAHMEAETLGARSRSR